MPASAWPPPSAPLVMVGAVKTAVVAPLKGPPRPTPTWTTGLAGPPTARVDVGAGVSWARGTVTRTTLGVAAVGAESGTAAGLGLLGSPAAELPGTGSAKK